MNDETVELINYQVRVGHVVVRVRARDEQEAIELAKRKLSHEMPRLYDVIRSLDATRFEVDHAA